MTKKYVPPQRNYRGVKHEDLRKVVDPKFNKLHDELTECYYEGMPFGNYGILDKETFDKLHGLIFLHRDVEFHTENMKLSSDKRVPEEEYNLIRDRDGNVIGKKHSEALKKISELSKQGVELTFDQA